MIDKTKIFPVALILIDLAATVMYATTKDWRKVTYWVAAAIINVAVTF